MESDLNFQKVSEVDYLALAQDCKFQLQFEDQITVGLIDNPQKPNFAGVKINQTVNQLGKNFQELAPAKRLDFDDEARKLFKKINYSGDQVKDNMGFSREPDVVYQHPTSGAKFYIGDEMCAQDLKILSKLKIFHIVNCKGASGVNYHESNKNFTYIRFEISSWFSYPNVKTAEGVLRFFEKTHSFIDKALAQGHNVMVHCLAGAHRAGTTGVSYVMKAADLNFREALKITQMRRPIVQPIGGFDELLRHLEAAYKVYGR